MILMPFLTQNQLLNIMKSLSFSPEKELGQCFLVNKHICQKMIEFLEFNSKENRVMEIGSGFGAFSDLILDFSKELYLVENSKICARYLEKYYQKLGSTSRIEKRQIDFLTNIPRKTRITIIEADILDIPWPGINYIVANLPFKITFSFLIKLIENWDYINVVLIIQKEVIKTLEKKSGESGYGVLSVLSQLFFSINKTLDLKKNHFYPEPEVNSGIIQLKPTNRLISTNNEYLTSHSRKAFVEFTQTLFKYKNRNFDNALKSIEKNNPSFINEFSNLKSVIIQKSLSKIHIKNVNPYDVFQLFQESWT